MMNDISVPFAFEHQCGLGNIQWGAVIVSFQKRILSIVASWWVFWRRGTFEREVLTQPSSSTTWFLHIQHISRATIHSPLSRRVHIFKLATTAIAPWRSWTYNKTTLQVCSVERVYPDTLNLLVSLRFAICRSRVGRIPRCNSSRRAVRGRCSQP